MRAVVVTPVDIRADDIPQSLAEAIKQLPGFDPVTNGWDEPDFDEFPHAGAVLVGEVDDVEISVAKLRTGSVQLTFAFHAESEEIGEEDEAVTCGVAWLFPSEIYPEDEDGRAHLACAFRAQGYLHAILEHEQLLSMIRYTDDALGRFLFGDPKQFMALNANYSRLEDGEEVLIDDEELNGNAFIRIFTFKVGMAQPYTVG